MFIPLYYIIDCVHLWNGSPFIYSGNLKYRRHQEMDDSLVLRSAQFSMHSLFVYVFSCLFSKVCKHIYIYEYKFTIVPYRSYPNNNVECLTENPNKNFAGMNSMLLYVGHELCFQLFPWHWRIASMNTHFFNLLENVWGSVLWTLIAYILFKKQVFLSI